MEISPLHVRVWGTLAGSTPGSAFPPPSTMLLMFVTSASMSFFVSRAKRACTGTRTNGVWMSKLCSTLSSVPVPAGLRAKVSTGPADALDTMSLPGITSRYSWVTAMLMPKILADHRADVPIPPGRTVTSATSLSPGNANIQCEGSLRNENTVSAGASIVTLRCKFSVIAVAPRAVNVWRPPVIPVQPNGRHYPRGIGPCIAGRRFLGRFRTGSRLATRLVELRRVAIGAGPVSDLGRVPVGNHREQAAHEGSRDARDSPRITGVEVIPRRQTSSPACPDRHRRQVMATMSFPCRARGAEWHHTAEEKAMGDMTFESVRQRSYDILGIVQEKLRSDWVHDAVLPDTQLAARRVEVGRVGMRKWSDLRGPLPFIAWKSHPRKRPDCLNSLAVRPTRNKKPQASGTQIHWKIRRPDVPASSI